MSELVFEGPPRLVRETSFVDRVEKASLADGNRAAAGRRQDHPN